MKEIPLTQGKVAMVDDEDFEYLSKNKWFCAKGRNTFYAQRRDGKNGPIIHMHRLIMNTSINKEVDHIDCNGLNNQKVNLRNCTRIENSYNSRMKSTNQNKVKGISFAKWANMYRVQLKTNGKRIHVGYFKTIFEASSAYNKHVLQTRGAFAKINKEAI